MGCLGQMPRPYKLGVPTVTYNLNIPIELKEKLVKQAHVKSRELGVQVSIADLIREKLEWQPTKEEK